MDPMVGAGLTAAERAVVLRPVRPQDAGAVAAFFEGLSTASRRRRFHGAVAQLPAALLHRFTHPDPATEQAWLAFAVEPGGSRDICIGEARYAATDGPADQREFALVVADGWQGRGVGAALLCALTSRARRHGVARLHGDVQRDNRPMIALAHSQGFRAEQHPSDARLLRLVKSIGASESWNPARCGPSARPGPAAASLHPSATAVAA